MHGGHRPAVAGDADEPHQSLRSRLDRRPRGRRPAPWPDPSRPDGRGSAAGSGRRGRPGSRSSDRWMSSCASRAVRSPVLVARKKSWRWRAIHGPMRSSASPYRAAVSMWLTPWREQQLQRVVGLCLGGAGQGGGSEQRHRALMACPSERSSLDHRSSMNGYPAGSRLDCGPGAQSARHAQHNVLEPARAAARRRGPAARGGRTKTPPRDSESGARPAALRLLTRLSVRGSLVSPPGRAPRRPRRCR